MDNLESQTYEVFERDPIKYKLYEEVGIHTHTYANPGPWQARADDGRALTPLFEPRRRAVR